MTRRFRTLALTAISALGIGLIPQAHGQSDYPSQPITIVVPFPAGSGTDLVSRHIAKEMTDNFNIPVLVDNKPGANGFIAATTAAKAAPDGYTVLVTTNTTHAANENLFKTLPYSPSGDFEPVTQIAENALVVVVRPASPYDDLNALVDAMRKSPGKLNFGAGSSSTRAGGELLRTVTETEAVHVPYKGNPQALSDLIGGQIDFMTVDLTPAIPMIQAGQLRALAVTSQQRSDIFPDVPTVEEVLNKPYEMTAWIGAYLPAKTPQAQIDKMNEMLHKAASSQRVQEFLQASGGRIKLSSPAELKAFGKSETEKWARIVEAAGIEPQ